MKLNRQRLRIFKALIYYHLMVSLTIFACCLLLCGLLQNSGHKIVAGDFLGMLLGLVVSFFAHLSAGSAWIIDLPYTELKKWVYSILRAQCLKLFTLASLMALVFITVEEVKKPSLAAGFLLVFLISYLAPVLLLNMRFNKITKKTYSA